MSRRLLGPSILVCVLLVTTSVLAQKAVTATEAKDHIGEQATVCGKVVSTRWAERSRGSPTFLNFDQPYPDQVFTLVIWGSDRPKFGEPETALTRGTSKRVCLFTLSMLRCGHTWKLHSIRRKASVEKF